MVQPEELMATAKPEVAPPSSSDEDPVCHSADELDVRGDDEEEEEEEKGDRLGVPQHAKLTRTTPSYKCSGKRRRWAVRGRKAVGKNNSSHAMEAADGGACSRKHPGLMDWTDQAEVHEHLWQDTGSSTDLCYVGEEKCEKHGPRKKCTACRILVHTACLEHKINFPCKPTFREGGVPVREFHALRHHWVHRRRQEGKCKQCSKSFQQKFAFSNSKDIVAISCSWCKAAYHNKVSCFKLTQINEPCNGGQLANIIVPPSWIVRLNRKGSVKNPRRKRTPSRRQSRLRRSRDDAQPFTIRPAPATSLKPLVVFINPKSGGNQGARLLQQFHWLLNPRQVFDLSEGGPRMGLELYKKVSNIRVLACGGDGTVGWILSTLDSLGMSPPVAILPLGTGNDLARTLNWGGTYTDEPLTKLLASVEESQVVQLDRWNLNVKSGSTSSDTTGEEGEKEGETVCDKLPLSVMNNYFSLGADAHVTLEFHESREANPEKFNSRFRNRLFYAGAGSREVVKQSWKDLHEHVSLTCDGQDFTPKLRELKLHCLLFLNIPRYSGGRLPWGSHNQNFADGSLEVIGFTAASLATLQVGGHGHRLCQCSEAVLTTTKPIPMQVDGEPCRLASSKIYISLRNQANMLLRPKRRGSIPIINDVSAKPERLRMQVSRISVADYERAGYKASDLRARAVPLGIVLVDTSANLAEVRGHVNRLFDDMIPSREEAEDEQLPVEKDMTRWCFLDSPSADKFFKLDRAQEQLHAVSDVSSEELYILDPAARSSNVKRWMSQPAGPQPSLGPRAHGFRFPVTPPRSPNLPTLLYDGVPEEEEAEEQPAKSKVSLRLSVPSQKSSSEPSSPVTLSPEPVRYVKRTATPPAVLNTVASGEEAVAARSSAPVATKIRPVDKKLLDASKRGDVDVFKDLHAQGASLVTTDQYGMTVLHHAARFGHKDVLKFILDHAPRRVLDLKDKEKEQTALHKAAWYQRRTICYMLVTAGASLTEVDHKGNTPRMQALEANDKELAAYLESQEHFQLVVSENLETAV